MIAGGMCMMSLAGGLAISTPFASANDFLPGSVLTNKTSTNALSIMQNATVGNGRATGGSFLINNTGNEHTGLTVYSNQGAAVAQPLMRLEVDNTAWDEEVLYIRSDSPTSRGLIRLDSPAPEIEFVETDQTGAAGKFEVRVQHDTFQINSRRSDDTTFENQLTLTHAGDLVLEAGSLVVKGDAPSEFEGGINITGGCLAVNGTCLTGDALKTDDTETSKTVSGGGTNGTATVVSGMPPATSCNSYDEQGAFVLDSKNNRLYVCNGPERGWDYTTLSN